MRRSIFRREEQSSPECRRHIRFTGRVQGVGFRYQAKRAADIAGCTGWVRNESDGSVTMEIQGSRSRIDEVITELLSDRYIHIDDIDISIVPVDPKEKRFRTEYY